MNKTTKTRFKPGPKPQYDKDKKVLILRAKGLFFREIARVMREDVSNTYRRYKRALSGYPQYRRD